MQWEVNYFVAVAIGLVLAAAIGWLVEVAVIRRFRKAPRLILTVATIGIAQVLAGLAILIPLAFERHRRRAASPRRSRPRSPSTR